ncbi:SPOR domain-containing protein [Pseudomonadota bacterium]
MHILIAFFLILITLQSHAASLAYQQGQEASSKGNHTQAHDIFLKAAKQGDAWSQFGLGVLYLNGQGATINEARSTEWFQKAANQGISFAQFNLGNAYLHGRGVSVDLARAGFWWQQAAEQGSTNAQTNLGTLMYFNYATKASKRLGMAWLLNAANQGDDAARTQLMQIHRANVDEKDSIWEVDPELSEVKILTMPSNYFSINLFSAKKKISVENFLRKYNMEGKVYIYRFPKGDNFLYGILYGSYSSREEAKETINSMRSELREHGPWSVALNSIKNKIRSMQTKQLQQENE